MLAKIIQNRKVKFEIPQRIPIRISYLALVKVMYNVKMVWKSDRNSLRNVPIQEKMIESSVTY